MLLADVRGCSLMKIIKKHYRIVSVFICDKHRRISARKNEFIKI